MMEGLHGRHVRAMDLADRLIPDLNLNEGLLWPPDLFAYTSYVLTFTSAYQLVVSPPSGRRWQPPREELQSWLFDNAEVNLHAWFSKIKEKWEVPEMTHDFRPCLEALGQWRYDGGEYNKAKFENEELDIQKQLDPRIEFRTFDYWEHLARLSGRQWRKNLEQLDESLMARLLFRKTEPGQGGQRKQDQEVLLATILQNTPPCSSPVGLTFITRLRTRTFVDEEKYCD